MSIKTLVAALRAELVEERLQRRGVAARRHDRAGLMVDDGAEVALAAAVVDLVDADRDQPREPRLVAVLGDDALDDAPDGVPADQQQPRDGSGQTFREGPLAIDNDILRGLIEEMGRHPWSPRR